MVVKIVQPLLIKSYRCAGVVEDEVEPNYRSEKVYSSLQPDGSKLSLSTKRTQYVRVDASKRCGGTSTTAFLRKHGAFHDEMDAFVKSGYQAAPKVSDTQRNIALVRGIRENQKLRPNSLRQEKSMTQNFLHSTMIPPSYPINQFADSS